MELLQSKGSLKLSIQLNWMGMAFAMNVEVRAQPICNEQTIKHSNIAQTCGQSDLLSYATFIYMVSIGLVIKMDSQQSSESKLAI